VTVTSFFLFVGVLDTCFGVSLGFRVFLEHAAVLHVHIDIGFLLHSKSLRSRSDLGCTELHGEFNSKTDEHVAKFVRLFIERKTLVRDSLQAIGLDDFSGGVLNSELLTIKVSDSKVDTSECFMEGNFLLHEDVGSLSLESLVF
jgi:hypothetical protein